MAKSRRYTIEVKDAKLKSVVVAAVVDWTSDERHIAVAQIFRLPGVGESKTIAHRLSQRRASKRNAAIAGKRQPKRRRK
jgi:imidazoleglycerol phosphate synthase glutamine amidotransferase subunit HisH